jgi:hypothetical protein
MAPAGVGIAEPLTLGAVLAHESLAVSVARKVGGVDRNVAAKVGILSAEGGGQRV